MERTSRPTAEVHRSPGFPENLPLYLGLFAGLLVLLLTFVALLVCRLKQPVSPAPPVDVERASQPPGFTELALLSYEEGGELSDEMSAQSLEPL
ncbi:UNVERIFIED_CONTAM: hypothetical protein FKN15_033018 [Acipenser sinensis]